MNLFRKNNGSISIFLTLILVPVIVVCTVFIDVSRIKLAEGVAHSAGDLALNTVLTQYDVELADYYGMMASSQDIEEFYEVSQGYFEACMVSQGIDTNQAKKWAGDLVNIFIEGESIVDYININLDDTTVTIESPENANLANAAMMKQQIGDFMKYRAPIGLLQEATGLVDKFTGVQEKIAAMPAESIVQDNKTEYYEAENEVLQKALEIYELLIQYEDAEVVITKDFLDELLTIMQELDGEEADNNYYELHKKYIEYWCNTKDVEKFKSVASQAGSYSQSLSGDDFSANDIKHAIEACESAYDNYQNKLSAVNGKLDTIDFENAPNESQEYSKAQYWIAMDRTMGNTYDDYVKAYYKFKNAYEEMNYKYEHKYEEDIEEEVEEYVYDDEGQQVYNEDGTPATTTTIVVTHIDVGEESYRDGTIDSVCSSVSAAYSSHITSLTNEKVYKLSAKVEECCNAVQSNINRSTAEQEIKNAVKDIGEKYEKLVLAQLILDDIKGYFDGRKGSKFRNLVIEYNESFDTWESSVDQYKDTVVSDLIDTNDEEIAKIKGEATEEEKAEGLVRIELRVEDVDDFAEKINDAYDLIEDYRRKAESMCYHGKTVIGRHVTPETYTWDSGIYSLDDFDDAVVTSCSARNVVKNEIPVYTSELETYFQETWEWTDDLDNIKTFTDDTGPEIHIEITAGWKTVDAWLHDKFDGKELSSAKTRDMLKLLKDSIRVLPEQVAGDVGEYDNQTPTANEISTREGLPSAKDGDDEYDGPMYDKGREKDEDVTEQIGKTSDISDSLFGDVNFTDILTSGRDNIYAVQYIMSMFSYDTYELENKYNLAREPVDETKKEENIYNVKVEGLSEPITPKNAEKLFDNDVNIKAQWEDEKKTITYNKNLTNKMINKDHDEVKGNNWSYGNEVEYILYGGENEDNKDKLETTLYFVRYALNIGPVFTAYWPEEPVRIIASAISGATSGIIPQPLVKMIICLGLCAGETAIDMNYLKAGLPVVFVKDVSGDEFELFIAINGDKIGAFQEAIISQNNPPEGLFTIGSAVISDKRINFSYSDYLSMFLFISLCTSSDSIYLRTADVIQANMQENKNIDAYGENPFMMENAKTYFTLESTVKVNPLMVKLPFAQQNGTDVLDTTTWNTFEYKTTRGY